MSKRLLGIILIIIGILAYHLLANDFETSAIWQTEIESKIFSDPISYGENYIFWGGNKGKNIYKLFAINAYGQTINESQPLPHLPFDPIIIENQIIVADHARMLRAFTVPDFAVAWEVGAEKPFELPPAKCGNSNVLQSSGNSIYCFDGKTGKQIWDVTELEPIKNFACDKVLISIHGYKDVVKPSWKCNAYDIEDGLDLWSIKEPVSKEKPIFVKNTCIITTAEGEALVINQYTGEVLYRNGAKGYIAIKGLEDGVLLANQAYTNLVHLSLQTGKSWTTSMKKDFMGAAQIGSRIIVADKESLRCFEAESGELIWQKDLGDIYGAFAHRNGLFVTYKESFADRITYGICIGANSPDTLWTAKGTSIFKKPYPINEGDLLLNYDGTIRLMPKPVFQNGTTVTMPAINMPDPTKKVNQAFEKQEKNTPNDNNEKNKPAIPTEIPTVSDEEAGW